MIELECRKVKFYSSHDEAAFFTWAQAIPAVNNVVGQDSSIIIKIKTKRISDTSLRELLALFRRYNIPMDQLAKFRDTRNESWFASPVAYWYKSVFGDT
jgi:hypothetical protein